MTRKEANVSINLIISDAITQWPDMRYHQILSNLDIVVMIDGHIYDDYYTEPKDVLKRIQTSELYKQLYMKE